MQTKHVCWETENIQTKPELIGRILHTSYSKQPPLCGWAAVDVSFSTLYLHTLVVGCPHVPCPTLPWALAAKCAIPDDGNQWRRGVNTGSSRELFSCEFVEGADVFKVVVFHRDMDIVTNTPQTA